MGPGRLRRVAERGNAAALTMLDLCGAEDAGYASVQEITTVTGTTPPGCATSSPA